MPGARTWTNLLNYILFQAGWFICIVGTAAGWPWTSTAIGFFFVLAHLLLVRNPVQEGLLLLLSLLIGICVDAFHIYTGVLSFPLGSLHPALPPPWILVLWLQFAMTLHYSLGWLAGRYFFGAVLGGISGALAYWAGVRFGAAAFEADLFLCLLQIGLSWSMVMVILIWAADRTLAPDFRPVYRVFTEESQEARASRTDTLKR